MSKTCTILFTDGESVTLQYETQVDPMIGAQLVEEVLSRNYLAFESDGKMVVYPTANIRSFTVDPAPEKLPKSIIRDAKRV